MVSAPRPSSEITSKSGNAPGAILKIAVNVLPCAIRQVDVTPRLSGATTRRDVHCSPTTSSPQPNEQSCFSYVLGSRPRTAAGFAVDAPPRHRYLRSGVHLSLEIYGLDRLS